MVSDEKMYGDGGDERYPKQRLGTEGYMRRKGLTACGLGVLLAFGLMACGNSQSAGEQVQESGETDAAAKEYAAVGPVEENKAGELPADLDFTVNYDGIKTAKNTGFSRTS